jgi:hypothetical protein
MYPPKANTPERRSYDLRILGANGANPTVELGDGMTVTRANEGEYLITWTKNPGVFVGWRPGLGAATPADLVGYTVVRDTYSTTTKSMTFFVYNALDAAADLIAGQYLDLEIVFKETDA